MTSGLQQCILLLANVVSALVLVSGIKNNEITVCTGDSVQAFQIIDFDPCNSNVSVSINGKRNIQIANWSFANCIRNETLLKKYEDKVILSQNGTITINNVRKFDQGKYVVISKKDVLPKMQQVDIKIMDPPNEECKPNIERVENMLIATIKSVDCGHPVTTPYWKDSEAVSGKDKRILKITPGNEARTYVACIEGVSLQCERSIKQINHCTTFVLRGQNNITQSTTSSSTESPNAAIIVLAILLAMAIIVIVIMSLILCNYRSKLKYSKKLLNHDQQQDLKTYSKSLHVLFSCCADNSRLHSNGQNHTLERPLDMHPPDEKEREPLIEEQSKGDCNKSDNHNFLDLFGRNIAKETQPPDDHELVPPIETQLEGDCNKSDSQNFLVILGKNIAKETQPPDDNERLPPTETQLEVDKMQDVS